MPRAPLREGASRGTHPGVEALAHAGQLADDRVDPEAGDGRGEDLIDDEVEGRRPVESEVEQVEVSPDRDRVVVASRSGVLRVLGGADLRAVAARSRTQSGRTRSVSWSPDGATVLVGGSDGRLRFWDSATLRPLGESVALGGFGYDGVMAWFRPDGLVGGVVNETLLQGEVPRTFTFPATTQAWLAEACGFAARDLTDAEWELYLPGRPRIAVCPS